MTNDYDVGYKKPPVKNQFKKGQSGNSKGRQKGSKNITNLIDSELNVKISLQDGKKITKAEAIVKQMVNGAIKGQSKQIDTILKYSDKKSASKSDGFIRKLIYDGYTTYKDIDDYMKGYTKDLKLKKGGITVILDELESKV